MQIKNKPLIINVVLFSYQKMKTYKANYFMEYSKNDLIPKC